MHNRVTRQKALWSWRFVSIDVHFIVFSKTRAVPGEPLTAKTPMFGSSGEYWCADTIKSTVGSKRRLNSWVGFLKIKTSISQNTKVAPAAASL